jgi:hypothetical protein
VVQRTQARIAPVERGYAGATGAASQAGDGRGERGGGLEVAFTAARSTAR